MKGLFLSLALVFGLTAMSQEPVKFKAVKHNFGKIKQNVPVTASFTFTNNGNKPVVIENASADCGCTTPEFPKGAITKGKSGTIKVTYNAAAPGAFTKKVYVKFAGSNQPMNLVIEGEVITDGSTKAIGKPIIKTELSKMALKP